MKRIIFLAAGIAGLGVASINAQKLSAVPPATLTVLAPSVTRTQAILHYRVTSTSGSPYSSSCSVQISQGGSVSTTLVNDVNATLFPGSNLDSRAGSTINGNDRYFVAGTRTVQQGADNNWYSRALQANTLHTYQITCGASSQTGQFTTTNIPLGDGYPEVGPFSLNAPFGNRPAPTINYADQSQNYIDPLTGILIKRITTASTSIGGGCSPKCGFNYYLDISGGAWTNPQYAITNQVSSTLASTATAGAKLFIASNGFDQATSTTYGTSGQPVDMRLRVYGNGAGGAKLGICLTIDTHTCNTPAQAITLPTSTGEVDFPSNYPTSVFAGWGQATKPINGATFSDRPTLQVGVSGSTITLNSGQSTNFIDEWPVGAKVQITGGGASCPNNLATIATVSPLIVTVNENCGTGTSSTFQYEGGGVLVWLASGTSANVSFTRDYLIGGQFFGNSDGGFDSCNFNPITDISSDRNGNPTTPPQTGYICNYAATFGLYLWIPQLTNPGPTYVSSGLPAAIYAGEARLISSYYYGPGKGGPGSMISIASAWSESDPKAFYASNAGNGHYYKGEYTNTPAGIYTEYQPVTFPPGPDPIVWTDITASTSSIASQLAAFGGPAATAYATGLFPAISPNAPVDGYIYYDTSAGQNDGCILFRANADTNLLVQAYTSWDGSGTFNNQLRWGGCHFTPIGLSTWAYFAGNPMLAFDGKVGGPWPLQILNMYHNGTPVTFSQPITSVTTGTSTYFYSAGISLDQTFNQRYGTGHNVGPTVTISGATGNWAPANGTWQVQVAFGDLNGFTIPSLNSTSWGALTGSLTVSAAPPITSATITNVSNASPPVVTTNTHSVDGEVIANNNHLLDGDSVVFSNIQGSAQPNYYWHVLSPTTGAIYQDSAMTIPATYAQIAPANNGVVSFAEQCPSNLPSYLTSGMQFDSGGAVGPRCFTVTIAGEPCDRSATAAEQAAYPCGWAPANPSLAELQPTLLGDATNDIDRIGNGSAPYSEKMILVAKTVNSPTNITMTFMRWFGNHYYTTNPGNQGNIAATVHNPGWTPVMVPSGGTNYGNNGYVNILDPTNTLRVSNPNYGDCHGDTGYGYANTYTWANGCADPVVNYTLDQLFANNPKVTYNYSAYFAGASSSQLTYNLDQSYPSHRQKFAPLNETLWGGDWRAYNPSSGNSQGSGSTLYSGTGLALVSGYANTYTINNIAGSTNIKTSPLLGWGGPRLLQDISGPSSVISDSTTDSYCYAYNAGECMSGSTKGQIYVSMKGVNATSPVCNTNTYSNVVPCITGTNSNGGWAVQQMLSPVDTSARFFRRLTLGLAAPAMHFDFQTWMADPTGQWGFFVAPYVNGARSDWYEMKLPPWPGPDNQIRTNFIKIPVQTGTFPGAAYARILFGYVENGTPANFYCTTRAESCSTDVPASTPSDPFSFVSESARHVPAGSTIQIPAISGRVVYYEVQQLNSSGTVVWTGPVNVVSAP